MCLILYVINRHMGICFVTPLVFFLGCLHDSTPLPRCLKYIYIYIYLYPCCLMQNPPKPAGGAILGPERHLNGGLLPATGWFPISTKDCISSSSSPRTKNSPNILLFLPLVTPKITHSKFSLQKKNKGGDDTLITSQPENPTTRDHPADQSWPIPRHCTS